MICRWRKEDTVAYMEKRFKEQRDKEANTTYMAKFGGMIRTIFVLAVVAMMVGPSLMEIYNEQMNPVIEEA